MSTHPRLAAERRTVIGKKVAALRRSGVLPAVVFGGGAASEPVQVSALDWEILRRGHVSRNTLLDLVVDGETRPVLVHAISEHPVSRRPVHLDFQIVRMSEPMAVDVPVMLVGIAPAVDKMGGTLLHLRDTVHVRALPDDLPSSIEVDVTSLVDLETTLHVGDVVMPRGVTMLTEAAEPIARVQPPRIEHEEIAPTAAEAAEGAEAAEATAAGADEGSTEAS